jgi:hypothetical protein
MSKVPLCPYRKPSIGGKGIRGAGKVQEHPGHVAWRRKYKDLVGWIKAHPGKVAGRGTGPKKVIYYSYWQSPSRRLYSWCTREQDLPLGATRYANYQEWLEDQGCQECVSLHLGGRKDE